MSQRRLHYFHTESTSLTDFPGEIITEILSYLDFPDQERAFASSSVFYRARLSTVHSGIRRQTEWLKLRENTLQIPRRELWSHNAFLRIICQTFFSVQPTERQLGDLVTFFVQELIFAWMFPSSEPTYEEVLMNNSWYDYGIFHRRYPLLQKLALILRWNMAGPFIAAMLETWFEIQWLKIRDEEEVQEFRNVNYDQPPSRTDLLPHQGKILEGIEGLAFSPIVLFAPQDPAAIDFNWKVNDEQWAHPVFDRLKLYLSIPELWNLELRHMEGKSFENPYRYYRRIASRPFLALILYRVSETPAFALRVLMYLRYIELMTPDFDIPRDTRYWFEEGFVGATLYWSYYSFHWSGGYFELVHWAVVALIHYHMYLFGVGVLSDLLLNIVYFLRPKSLMVRTRVARIVMDELLEFGYDYCSDEARDAVVSLADDGQGNFGGGTVPINWDLERELAVVTPPAERATRSGTSASTSRL